MAHIQFDIDFYVTCSILAEKNLIEQGLLDLEMESDVLNILKN